MSQSATTRRTKWQVEHTGPEEQAKLKRIIDEGANVLPEVEDLNSGLKDTVKAVAEELEIKPN